MARRYAAVKKRTGPDTLNEPFLQATFLLGAHQAAPHTAVSREGYGRSPSTA